MKKFILSVGLTALLVMGTASAALAAPVEISGITGDSKTFVEVPADKAEELKYGLKIGIDRLSLLDQLEPDITR